MRCITKFAASRALAVATVARRYASDTTTTAAKSSPKDLGELSKVWSVDEASLKEMNPRVTLWAAVDVIARKRLEKIVATTPVNENIGDFYSAIAAPSQPIADGKAAMSKATDLKSLLKVYSEIVAPVHKLKLQYDHLELESFALKDKLKLGLSAFKQPALDKAKVDLEDVTGKMKKLDDEIVSIGKKNFTTEQFNELLNTMRLVMEKNPTVAPVAIKMFEDMTLLRIPFDETTKLLLHNVVFGDGPTDNSALLFSFVEYPERGSIVTKDAPLEQIAEETLKVIADRHQTPLTPSGTHLQLPDTHPCLQRSAE